jgi:hypothetical protein
VGQRDGARRSQGFSGPSFTGTGAQRWSGQFDNKQAYVRYENRLNEQQLANAGARSAELLNAIWPQGTVHKRVGLHGAKSGLTAL